ncbi:MAG: glycine C-acetyltransferase [Elusimicrobia bacterium]|nr:glycine C-acetyltransferase [Elusimicrobiota bacterium]
MLTEQFKKYLTDTIDQIKTDNLYKKERVISSPQGSWITLQDGRKVLNLCANNYLGLSGHPELVKAAKDGVEKWGYGLSSVRFICGTQEVHKELENKISEFLKTEDTILYSSCFDANGGLFETILSEEDVVISDQLNHASIIDGIRLCKAQRLRYANNDMFDLESKLNEASSARFKLIATDGVFSMDGIIAKLKDICYLAEKYKAMVMIDDSHSVGVIGKTGRGSHEYNNVMNSIDIITGTLGKALGGASGGYTSGRKEIINMLRQRSRPYLFSNTLAPGVASASLKALEMVSSSTELLEKLHENIKYFRYGMIKNGFKIKIGDHPIMPVLLGESQLAIKMAERLLEEGIYVIGFFYPIVPKGSARIRIQMSAIFSKQDLDFALDKLKKVGKELKII